MARNTDNPSPDRLDTRHSLLVRIQSPEDHASWKEFYENYRQYIASMAVRQGLGDEQANDVVQLVMMVVLREAQGFSYNPDTRRFQNAAIVKEGNVHSFERFRSWLKGVVQIKIWEVKKFVNRGGVRLPENYHPETMPEPVDPAPQPDEAAGTGSENDFHRALLDQAMETLKSRYRGNANHLLLFEQVALGGMAYAVVAETFGVSEVHARKIVHDLKSKLKTILQHLIRGSGEQTPFQNP